MKLIFLVPIMRLLSRALVSGLNLILVFSYINILQNYLNEPLITVIIIIDLLAAINVHYSKDYLLLLLEIPVFKLIFDIIPSNLQNLAIAGVILNIILIKNNLVSSFI